jgi:serine/threonine protein kinase
MCAGVNSLGICREYDRLKKVELELWGRIRHPNIVTAFTLYENAEHHNLYLMMQYADLGQIGFANEAEMTYQFSEKVSSYLYAEQGCKTKES